MLSYFLLLSIGVACAAVVITLAYKLNPKPYPSIPYNAESANRLAGDIPIMAPLIQATNEFSSSVFAATTQRLGVPIAQLLFPAIRKPLIILEDPRKIEDIVLRRNKEFDKSPTAVDLMAPMFPHSSLSQLTTPKLRAQKRLWADVMSTEFLRKAAAPNIHRATLNLLEFWRLKASTVFRDLPFPAHEDFQNVTLGVV